MTTETLRANPNVLPDAWIDRLFQRFSTLYGNDWSAKWAGIPMAEVKATWATALARFDAETLRRALDHCAGNNKFPPTCPEFVGLCLAWRAVANNVPQVSVRYGDIDPKVLAAIAEHKTAGRKFDPKAWAREIIAGEAEGTYRHLRGIHCAKVALGIITE